MDGAWVVVASVDEAASVVDGASVEVADAAAVVGAVVVD